MRRVKSSACSSVASIDEIRQWLTPAPSEKRGLRLTKVQQLLTRDGVAVLLDRAGFDEPRTFEDFDWTVPVSFDRDRVRALGNLVFLERHEDVIFLGPTGVGKSSLASALGHAACRAGKRVLFLRNDDVLKRLHQSRADNSTERVLRSLLAPDLLIIDDFGLKRLTAQQSSDFYEVVIERHKRASTIVTSNRAIEEWIPLFDDAILAQSALDRLAHNAHQIVMDGPSYRSRQRPGQTHSPEPTPKPIAAHVAVRPRASEADSA